MKMPSTINLTLSLTSAKLYKPHFVAGSLSDTWKFYSVVTGKYVKVLILSPRSTSCGLKIIPCSLPRILRDLCTVNPFACFTNITLDTDLVATAVSWATSVKILLLLRGPLGISFLSEPVDFWAQPFSCQLMGTNWGNGQHVRAVWIKEALLNEVGGGTIWTFENLPISQLDNYLIPLLLGMRSPNGNNFACDLKYNIKMPEVFFTC